MAGRDELIEKLFDEEYEHLIRKAFRLSGDIHRAQDLVQETFSLALVHYEELSVHPCPKAWLATALFNLSMNDRRRMENLRSVSLEQMGDVFPAEIPSNLFEIMPKKIKEDDKRLLALRFEQGLNYREIAEALGISEGARRARMLRLLKKLQKNFDFSKKK